MSAYLFFGRYQNETGNWKKYERCVCAMMLRIASSSSSSTTPHTTYYKNNYDSQLFQSRFKITIKEENLTVDPGNNNQQQQTTKVEQKIAKLSPRLLVSFLLLLSLSFFKTKNV